MAQLIITALGDDRPGIVGELTGRLHAAGGNIVDSRMVNLRGRFALLMLLEVPDAAEAELRARLPDVGRDIGLAVQVATGAKVGAGKGGLPFRLKSYSMDQPGIVHRISDLLQRYRVNIEDLRAGQQSGAFVGHELFVMEARLTVPAEVSVRKLRADLESLGEQINCDIDLEPA